MKILTIHWWLENSRVVSVALVLIVTVAGMAVVFTTGDKVSCGAVSPDGLECCRVLEHEGWHRREWGGGIGPKHVTTWKGEVWYQNGRRMGK